MTTGALPQQAQYGLTPQQLQQQYAQQQARQLQMQQQGYLLQQQRQQAEQAGYGAGGYRGPSAASAADNALARRLQEEEMAGEDHHSSHLHSDVLPSMVEVSCTSERQRLDNPGFGQKPMSQLPSSGVS